MLLLFLPLETPARQGQASAKEEPVVWEKDGVLWADKAWSTSIGHLRLAYFTGSPEEIGAQMFHLVIAPEFEKMMESFAFIKQQGPEWRLLGTDFLKTFMRSSNLSQRLNVISPGNTSENLRGSPGPPVIPGREGLLMTS